MSELHPTPPDVTVAPRRLGDLAAVVEAAGLLASPLDAEWVDVEITDVVHDSRKAGPGSLFGALSADTASGRDGHTFIDAALDLGAAAALVSDGWWTDASVPVPLGKGERLRSAALVPTTDTRAALAEVASAFYGLPGQDLTLLAVTGTNGKTTTVFLLHHLLTALGETAGLVGTIENRIGTARYATAYTTPEAPDLQKFLRACVDHGCSAVAMEASSHGLALDRVRTLGFDVAIFTNLTQDHLDFHPTFEAYRDAKKSLFDGLAAGSTAIVNADDGASPELVRDSAARVVTFGTSPDADVRVEVLENTVSGLRLRLDGHDRRFELAGRFNALNLAAAYAAGRALGHDAEAVLDALATAPGVPGRFETVRSDDGVLGIVDYAHTPDALDNVLATAREIVPDGNELWAVFGCGGDRDAGKRPQMAAIAEARADRVVCTSDNPRTEDPDAILDDVAAGLRRPDAAARIPDRQLAIRHAAEHARAGDVIVVAGKGHETYQILGTERRDFDDRVELRTAFTHRTEAA